MCPLAGELWVAKRRSRDRTANQTAQVTLLRPGAPGWSSYPRGSRPSITSLEDKTTILQEFDDSVYAASSLQSIRSRLRTVRSILAEGGEVTEVSVEGIRILVATLKNGGYRSAKLDLPAARVASQRPTSMDGMMPAVIARGFTEAERACTRGLGPATQASGLPPDKTSWFGGGLGELGLLRNPERSRLCGDWNLVVNEGA